MTRRVASEEDRAAAAAARAKMVEELHRQLTDTMTSLDAVEAWQQWLDLARKFHRYSFQNTMLILAQTGGNATAVAGYQAWRALGHQVRRGEKAIKVLAPVIGRADRLDPETGVPILDAGGQKVVDRRIVGVKPVSVFDVSQVDPPVSMPPVPTPLRGVAPEGMWDSLAHIVAEEGFELNRGDCGDAFGVTSYVDKEVRVREGLDGAQAVKTLAHELAHILLPPPRQSDPDSSPVCRGILEVEAESVAYMVTKAHGLDTGQYTFNYVAGWAARAQNEGESIADVVARTGQRVMAAADSILSRTLADDMDVRIAAAVGDTIDVSRAAVGAATRPAAPTQAPLWESVREVPRTDHAVRPSRMVPNVAPAPTL